MTGPRADPKAPSGSLLVPPLYACLPQQLAVLLLGHSLAALLDNGAHSTTLARRSRTSRHACARPTPAGRGTRQRFYTPTAYVTVPARCPQPEVAAAGLRGTT